VPQPVQPADQTIDVSTGRPEINEPADRRGILSFILNRGAERAPSYRDARDAFELPDTPEAAYASVVNAMGNGVVAPVTSARSKRKLLISFW
jgi:hypothetical protein